MRMTRWKKQSMCSRSTRYCIVLRVTKLRISLTFVLLVAPFHFFIIENLGAAAFSLCAFLFLPIWPVSWIETYGLGRSNGGERRNAHATPEIYKKVCGANSRGSHHFGPRTFAPRARPLFTLISSDGNVHTSIHANFFHSF